MKLSLMCRRNPSEAEGERERTGDNQRDFKKERKETGIRKVGTTEQRVREKKAAFMNSPRQGRRVLFYKPPTTNSKHAHPKLEGEGKSSQGAAGDKGW